MRLLELAPVVDHAGGEGGGREVRPSARREVAEQPLAQLDQRVVIDLAGGGDDARAAAILDGEPVAEILRRDRGDRRLVAQDRAAERLPRVGRRLEMVEDDVVGRVARLAEFLQHHRLFALELVGVEARVADEIGDQIEAKGSVVGEQSRVEHRHVARGIGVERAADVLDLLGDDARRPRGGTLEDHVLEQVRDAVGPRLLEPRAGVDVEADRDRLDVGHRLADDADAVGEGRQPGHAASAAARIGVARAAT